MWQKEPERIALEAGKERIGRLAVFPGPEVGGVCKRRERRLARRDERPDVEELAEVGRAGGKDSSRFDAASEFLEPLRRDGVRVALNLDLPLLGAAWIAYTFPGAVDRDRCRHRLTSRSR